MRVNGQRWKLETGYVVVGGHGGGRWEELVRSGAWSGGGGRAWVGLGGHGRKDGAFGDGVIGGKQGFDIFVDEVAS